MSNVWFTSDLHIGHKLVSATRWEIDGKPAYPDPHNLPSWYGDYEVRRHDEILADNWDSTVGEDDTVWVLGDISSGTSTAQQHALGWMADRPGRKHLIAGNHDGPHPMHRDAHKWYHAYGTVFESVQMAARRRIPLTEGHCTVLLSHFPYVGDREFPDRHVQWRLPDLGDPVLHGHTHSDRKLTETDPGTLQIHVGVDAWGGKPVSLQTISELIEGNES